MKEKKTYWGYHLIIDASDCNPDAIRSYKTIYDFTKRLVKDIDMVAFGEPHIVDFGHGDKSGYSLVQLIETSNICGHFVNEYNDIYLDVFSCKPYDKEVVINLVKEVFEPNNVKTVMVNRQA